MSPRKPGSGQVTGLEINTDAPTLGSPFAVRMKPYNTQLAASSGSGFGGAMPYPFIRVTVYV